MRILYWTLSLVLLFATGCADKNVNHYTDQKISDPQPSEMLQDYYNIICDRLERGIMLGHQDALAYGSMWYGDVGRSDIKSIYGDNPAVVGWNLGKIEVGSAFNTDSVAFDQIKKYTKELDSNGGITVFTWNPECIISEDTTLISSSDYAVSFLPEGQNNDKYIKYLDSLSNFLTDVKNEKGDPIPIVLRIFTRPNIDTNTWWSTDNCTEDDYKKLWSMTINYLRNNKKIHHVLYAYSVYNPNSENDIQKYYPGNEYVDIVGVDLYDDMNKDTEGNEYFNRLDNNLKLMTDFAVKHKKIASLTETGLKGVKISNYFSSILNPIVSKYKLSYILFGRNAWGIEEDYYIPVLGHPAAEDFVKFANEPHILIGKKIEKFNSKS